MAFAAPPLTPAHIGPLILLVVAIGLLIGGVNPAWWITMLAAIVAAAVIVLTGVGARRR